MMAKYLLGEYILLFSNLPGLAYIYLIIFAFCKNRIILLEALYISCFAVILNTTLKHLYQTPLSTELGKIGYAFPSGHMQFATVLYGYMALKYHSKLIKLLASLVIFTTGWALVLFGFHNWEDISGSVIVAILLLFVILDQPQFPTKAIFVAASILLSCLTFIITIKLYLIIPYLIMILLVFGEHLGLRNRFSVGAKSFSLK